MRHFHGLVRFTYNWLSNACWKKFRRRWKMFRRVARGIHGLVRFTGNRCSSACWKKFRRPADGSNGLRDTFMDQYVLHAIRVPTHCWGFLSDHLKVPTNRWRHLWISVLRRQSVFQRLREKLQRPRQKFERSVGSAA